MRYATVCSGAEAFGPAWHKLGYEPVFHAEIEKHASAVLAYHYPTVPNYGDFTTIAKDGHTTGPVRLLCGGTPCQTFSVAGLREGLDSYKGGLSLEFVKLAKRLRAQWILWENVPGVLSADGGEAFGSFLGALAECGYGFAYRVLDAQHFGVPQRRRRVFVVGYLGDWRPAAAVLFESESLSGHIKKGRQEGEGVTGTLTTGSSTGGGYRTGVFEAQSGLIVPATVGTLTASYGNATGQDYKNIPPIPAHSVNENQRGELTLNPIANCLQTSGGKPGQGYPAVLVPATFVTGERTHALTAEGFDASEDGTGRGTPIVAECYGISNQPTPKFVSDLMPSLDAKETGGGRMEAVAYSFKQGAGAAAGSIGYAKELAPTLTAGSSGTQQSPGLLQGSAVRRLTPRECERLMGWPDDWTRYGIDAKGKQYELADGPRYRICGNGWAEPPVTWLANRIKQVDTMIFY